MLFFVFLHWVLIKAKLKEKKTSLLYGSFSNIHLRRSFNNGRTKNLRNQHYPALLLNRIEEIVFDLNFHFLFYIVSFDFVL